MSSEKKRKHGGSFNKKRDPIMTAFIACIVVILFIVVAIIVINVTNFNVGQKTQEILEGTTNSNQNNNVTKENYDLIKAGMTKEQVIKIMGDNYIRSESEKGKTKIEIYMYTSIFHSIYVSFKDNKVIEVNWT